MLHKIGMLAHLKRVLVSRHIPEHGSSDLVDQFAGWRVVHEDLQGLLENRIFLRDCQAFWEGIALGCSAVLCHRLQSLFHVL